MCACLRCSAGNKKENKEVGGVICLVHSVNERDLNLLNSYT